MSQFCLSVYTLVIIYFSCLCIEQENLFNTTHLLVAYYTIFDNKKEISREK